MSGDNDAGRLKIVTYVGPAHPELQGCLLEVPPHDRAERLRYLASLGTLLLKGQVPLVVQAVASAPGAGQPALPVNQSQATDKDPNAGRRTKLAQKLNGSLG